MFYRLNRSHLNTGVQLWTIGYEVTQTSKHTELFLVLEHTFCELNLVWMGMKVYFNDLKCEKVTKQVANVARNSLHCSEYTEPLSDVVCPFGQEVHSVLLASGL